MRQLALLLKDKLLEPVRAYQSDQLGSQRPDSITCFGLPYTDVWSVDEHLLLAPAEAAAPGSYAGERNLGNGGRIYDGGSRGSCS
jgi:hypothetical protein